MKRLGVFFFFQAEDGIRDADVTGVQTCALPISPGMSAMTYPLRSCPMPDSWERIRLPPPARRSEEHTSELQSRPHLVCRLLLEKKKNSQNNRTSPKKNTPTRS